MDNLSMAAGIGDHIGALELDSDLASHSDGVLEAAASASFGPPPLTVACRTADIRLCM